MNQLIEIKNNGVLASDLYTFIYENHKSKTEFAKWIKRKISDYGFIEGKDFSSFLAESSGGRPLIDYAISVNMAKEICMVEKNEKGKEARRYFIAIEEKYKQSLIRDSGKLTRRNLTDVIQDMGINEKQHGHAYSNFTKLVYKKLGIEYTKEKSFRDRLSAEQLKAIEILESLAKSYLELGYDYSQIKNVLPDCINVKDVNQIGV